MQLHLPFIEKLGIFDPRKTNPKIALRKAISRSW